MSGVSLTDLLNDMIARLEDTQPEMMRTIPEERYWHMISLYIQVDPVLAQLYKQYCDARDNLGQLLSSADPNSPMAEIAWDMHDSLRSAIDTRLLELKDNDTVTARILALKNQSDTLERQKRKFEKQKSESHRMENLMAFMLWTGLVLKDVGQGHYLRAEFGQAS